MNENDCCGMGSSGHCICPKCQARTFESVNLPLQGKLLTFTVIRVAPPLVISEGEVDELVDTAARVLDLTAEALRRDG